MIEGMCIVCHGPLERHGDRVTAVYCSTDGGNCRRVGYSMFTLGRPLPWKYASLRITHAYRRELLAFERHVMALAARGERKRRSA